MDFLTLLQSSLRPGLMACSSEMRARHAHWILKQQCADGGFANRRGHGHGLGLGTGDLYYTAFALRSLAVLNALETSTASAAFLFLEKLRNQDAAARIRQPHGAFCDAVAATSWWDSLQLCEEILGPKISETERQEARAVCAARLLKLQREDGGIAKTDKDGCGSLYHTLLACSLAMRWSQEGQGFDAFVDPIRWSQFVRQLRAPEKLASGGFLENRYSRRPATNGSAAGITLSMMLSMIQSLNDTNDVPNDDEELLQRDLNFLAEQQGDEGGWLAASGAPMADLLSTFSALFVLQQSGWKNERARTRARAYAQSLELDDGGFVGFALEQQADCEYTFYGLGVLALTQS